MKELEGILNLVGESCQACSHRGVCAIHQRVWAVIWELRERYILFPAQCPRDAKAEVLLSHALARLCGQFEPRRSRDGEEDS